MFYLFILISLITFVFAEFFVFLIGGEQYLVTDPFTGANAVTIMRIFSFYGLLLPIDRMTGVGLDSINKPGKNFLKVLVMVIANVIGDLIAIFVFRSLELVAVGSILFTILGVWVGYYFIDKQLELKFSRIFSSGIEFYRTIYSRITHPGLQKK
jgi:O-antigen/teichoic acid export membrane protein